MGTDKNISETETAEEGPPILGIRVSDKESPYQPLADNWKDPPRPRIGRPPIADPKCTKLDIRVTPWQKARIQELADLDGETVSGYVLKRVLR